MAPQDNKGTPSRGSGTRTVRREPEVVGSVSTAAHTSSASTAYDQTGREERSRQLRETTLDSLESGQPAAHEPHKLSGTTGDGAPPEQTGAAIAPSTPTTWEGGKTQADKVTTTFYADAAAARRARLRFESGARGPASTSAAEHVRYKLTHDRRRTPSQAERGVLPATVEGQGRSTTSSRRGDERNANRLKVADAADRVTLGESPESVTRSCGVGHLPGDASMFFPEPIVGPNDEFDTPAWFLKAIRGICETPSPIPTKSPIMFEISEQAAKHNASVLGQVGFDVGRLIQSHESSTLGFGSEFRQVGELRPLLGRHPHFPQLEQLLSEGMSYVFDRELSPMEREKEVSAMLIRGNHKSAQAEQEQVGKLLAKDVLHGFAIPLPISAVRKIPGAMVQPLGLAQQWTVGPDGTRLIKYRLTQDLSFSTDRGAEPTSINSRVNMSAYVEMIYGWCLPRIIHYVVSLRLQFPLDAHPDQQV